MTRSRIAEAWDHHCVAPLLRRDPAPADGPYPSDDLHEFRRLTRLALRIGARLDAWAGP